VLIGLVTATAASACYGTGSVLQALGARRSAREEAARAEAAPAGGAGPDATTTEHGGPSLASTAKAVVTWEFILGTVLDFVGFLLGALAARLLPLFLSQTIISANLVITAVLSVRMLGLRLKRLEWTSIGVLCGALVLLAVAAGPEGPHHAAWPVHWWLLIGSVLLIAGGSLLVRRLGRSGAVVAGLLSGLGFGALGIGVRILDGVEPFDLGRLVTDPALYAILVGGLGGMYLHTVALQLGSVNAATAALVVGETVVPGVVGVIWLGDSSRPGFAPLAVFGFVLAVVSAVGVAWFGEGEGGALDAVEPQPAGADR
jgi:drug/metabolite transporter (DMT)-like permease